MAAEPQHMQAIALATEIRSRRAQLKREICSGRVHLYELLKEPIPDWLANEPIIRLLKAIPRRGQKLSARLLAELMIPERKPIGELTKRQKARLVPEVARWEAYPSARRLDAKEAEAATP